MNRLQDRAIPVSSVCWCSCWRSLFIDIFSECETLIDHLSQPQNPVYSILLQPTQTTHAMKFSMSVHSVHFSPSTICPSSLTRFLSSQPCTYLSQAQSLIFSKLRQVCVLSTLGWTFCVIGSQVNQIVLTSAEHIRAWRMESRQWSNQGKKWTTDVLLQW